MLISITSCNWELRLESLYWWVPTSNARINIDNIHASIEGYIGHYILLVIKNASSPLTHRKNYLEFYWVAVLVIHPFFFHDLISWRLTDSLTSKVSTAPYSVTDMQTMRDVIKEAKGTSISAVCRTMTTVGCRSWPWQSSRNRLNR